MRLTREHKQIPSQRLNFYKTTRITIAKTRVSRKNWVRVTIANFHRQFELTAFATCTRFSSFNLSFSLGSTKNEISRLPRFDRNRSFTASLRLKEWVEFFSVILKICAMKFPFPIQVQNFSEPIPTIEIEIQRDLFKVHYRVNFFLNSHNKL